MAAWRPGPPVALPQRCGPNGGGSARQSAAGMSCRGVDWQRCTFCGI